jgi:hypothetical protein
MAGEKHGTAAHHQQQLRAPRDSTHRAGTCTPSVAACAQCSSASCSFIARFGEWRSMKLMTLMKHLPYSAPTDIALLLLHNNQFFMLPFTLLHELHASCTGAPEKLAALAVSFRAMPTEITKN